MPIRAENNGVVYEFQDGTTDDQILDFITKQRLGKDMTLTSESEKRTGDTNYLLPPMSEEQKAAGKKQIFERNRDEIFARSSRVHEREAAIQAADEQADKWPGGATTREAITGAVQTIAMLGRSRFVGDLEEAEELDRQNPLAGAMMAPKAKRNFAEQAKSFFEEAMNSPALAPDPRNALGENGLNPQNIARGVASGVTYIGGIAAASTVSPAVGSDIAVHSLYSEAYDRLKQSGFTDSQADSYSSMYATTMAPLEMVGLSAIVRAGGSKILSGKMLGLSEGASKVLASSKWADRHFGKIAQKLANTGAIGSTAGEVLEENIENTTLELMAEGQLPTLQDFAVTSFLTALTSGTYIGGSRLAHWGTNKVQRYNRVNQNLPGFAEKVRSAGLLPQMNDLLNQESFNEEGFRQLIEKVNFATNSSFALPTTLGAVDVMIDEEDNPDKQTRRTRRVEKLREVEKELVESLEKADSPLFRDFANGDRTLEDLYSGIYDIARGRMFDGQERKYTEAERVAVHYLLDHTELKNAVELAHADPNATLPFEVVATISDVLKGATPNVRAGAIEGIQNVIYKDARDNGFKTTKEYINWREQNNAPIIFEQVSQDYIDQARATERYQDIASIDISQAQSPREVGELLGVAYQGKTENGPSFLDPLTGGTFTAAGDIRQAVMEHRENLREKMQTKGTRGLFWAPYAHKRGDEALVIQLATGRADPSTVMHELTHFLVERVDPNSVLNHMLEAAVGKWRFANKGAAKFGKNQPTNNRPVRRSQWTLNDHEAISQMAEAYFFNKSAISPEMAIAFEALGTEIQSIWKAANRSLNFDGQAHTRISKEAAGFFDTVFSINETEERIFSKVKLAESVAKQEILLLTGPDKNQQAIRDGYDAFVANMPQNKVLALPGYLDSGVTTVNGEDYYYRVKHDRTVEFARVSDVEQQKQVAQAVEQSAQPGPLQLTGPELPKMLPWPVYLGDNFEMFDLPPKTIYLPEEPLDPADELAADLAAEPNTVLKSSQRNLKKRNRIQEQRERKEADRERDAMEDSISLSKTPVELNMQSPPSRQQIAPTAGSVQTQQPQKMQQFYEGLPKPPPAPMPTNPRQVAATTPPQTSLKQMEAAKNLPGNRLVADLLKMSDGKLDPKSIDISKYTRGMGPMAQDSEADERAVLAEIEDFERTMSGPFAQDSSFDKKDFDLRPGPNGEHIARYQGLDISIGSNNVAVVEEYYKTPEADTVVNAFRKVKMVINRELAKGWQPTKLKGVTTLEDVLLPNNMFIAKALSGGKVGRSTTQISDDTNAPAQIKEFRLAELRKALDVLAGRWPKMVNRPSVVIQDFIKPTVIGEYKHETKELVLSPKLFSDDSNAYTRGTPFEDMFATLLHEFVHFSRGYRADFSKKSRGYDYEYSEEIRTRGHEKPFKNLFRKKVLLERDLTIQGEMPDWVEVGDSYIKRDLQADFKGMNLELLPTGPYDGLSAEYELQIDGTEYGRILGRDNAIQKITEIANGIARDANEYTQGFAQDSEGEADFIWPKYIEGTSIRRAALPPVLQEIAETFSGVHEHDKMDTKEVMAVAMEIAGDKKRALELINRVTNAAHAIEGVAPHSKGVLHHAEIAALNYLYVMEASRIHSLLGNDTAYARREIAKFRSGIERARSEVANHFGQGLALFNQFILTEVQAEFIHQMHQSYGKKLPAFTKAFAQLEPEDLIELNSLGKATRNNIDAIIEKLKKNPKLWSWQKRMGEKIVAMSKSRRSGKAQISDADLQKLIANFAVIMGKKDASRMLMVEMAMTNMLSNPEGRIRDFNSNLAFSAFRTYIRRPLLGAIDAVENKIAGKPRKIYALEAMTYPRMTKAAKTAMRILGGQELGLEYVTRWDELHEKRMLVSDEMIEYGDGVVQVMGYALGTVGRVCRATDAFFQIATYETLKPGMDYRIEQWKKSGTYEQNMREMAEGVVRRKDYKSDKEYQEAIQKAVGDPASLIQNAINMEARENTFQQDPGWLAAQVRAGRDMLDRHLPLPLAKVFGMPFIPTLMNITKSFLELTPAATGPVGILGGVLMPRMWGRGWREILANQIAAHMLMYVLYQMSERGWMTGGWPTDPAEQDFWIQHKIQPYSYKYQNGNEMGYLGIPEPFKFSLGPALDSINFMMKVLGDESKTWEEKAKAYQDTQWTSYRYLLKNSIFGETLSQITFSHRDNSSVLSKTLAGLAQRSAQTMMPYSALFRFWNRARQEFVDGEYKMYETRPSGDDLLHPSRLLAKSVHPIYGENFSKFLGDTIPGLESVDIPERITYFGETYTRDKLQTLLDIPVEWLPVGITAAYRGDLPNAVESEWQKLEQYPRQLSRKVTVAGVETELNDEQYRSACLLYGSYLYDNTAKLIREARYQQADEQTQKLYLQMLGKSVRTRVRGEVLRRYREITTDSIAQRKAMIGRR